MCYCQVAARRVGDVGACYCDPSFAACFLGWRATRGVKDMCEDAWRWQSANPQGFKPEAADAAAATAASK